MFSIAASQLPRINGWNVDHFAGIVLFYPGRAHSDDPLELERRRKLAELDSLLSRVEALNLANRPYNDYPNMLRFAKTPQIPEELIRDLYAAGIPAIGHTTDELVQLIWKEQEKHLFHEREQAAIRRKRCEPGCTCNRHKGNHRPWVRKRRRLI